MLGTHFFPEVLLVVLGEVGRSAKIAPEEMLAQLVGRGLSGLPRQLLGNRRAHEVRQGAALLIDQPAHLGFRLLVQSNRDGHDSLVLQDVIHDYHIGATLTRSPAREAMRGLLGLLYVE